MPGAAETSRSGRPLSPTCFNEFLQVFILVADWQSELWHYRGRVGCAVTLPVLGAQLPHLPASCLQESHSLSFPSSGDWKQLENCPEDATLCVREQALRP